MVLAIDPGPTESAFVWLNGETVGEYGQLPNQLLLDRMRDWSVVHRHEYLAIEMVASFGMPVGREVFDTCVWIGRYIQAWPGPHELVYRKAVVTHLCGSARAKDANVRQALIDRYGPGKQAAIGTIKKQGPLYGITADCWSALAVGVTYADQRKGAA